MLKNEMALHFRKVSVDTMSPFGSESFDKESYTRKW